MNIPLNQWSGADAVRELKRSMDRQATILIVLTVAILLMTLYGVYLQFH